MGAEYALRSTLALRKTRGVGLEPALLYVIILVIITVRKLEINSSQSFVLRAVGDGTNSPRGITQNFPVKKHKGRVFFNEFFYL